MKNPEVRFLQTVQVSIYIDFLKTDSLHQEISVNSWSPWSPWTWSSTETDNLCAALLPQALSFQWLGQEEFNLATNVCSVLSWSEV